MLRSKVWIPSLVIAHVAACAANNSSDGPSVQVIKPDAYDVSPPLTELAKLAMQGQLGLRAHEAEPVRPIPHIRAHSTGQVVDPVVQSAIGGLFIPSPSVNCEGQGAGLPGFMAGTAPPDSDGDIGPTHYVQIVNTSIAIFNRSCGIVMGPIPTNTLWSGFNGACATTNDGDGVVRYDRIANRWVISQFSVSGSTTSFFQCVAVSATPDPTGSYNRYQFSFNGLNDYPKMGLWPDAYYFTYNLFPNNTFSGARVCAVDRAKMIAGDPTATQQCFDTGNQFGALLAADLDGSILPPAGTPETFVALDTTALDVWKLHVDFTTPANSTFSGPTTVPVAAYTPLCNGGTCVTQPGTTNTLDSLADRLMNRLVYRKFADGHDAMVVSHAVAVGSGGGVRWYELRNPTATTPTMFQQGTYGRSSEFRWMSSMTFDQAGDIGLGFSISSATIFPGIRYTGRLVTDPLSTMPQGEGTIAAGSGSQTGNLARWGDYSSMNIDPTDDCTFWYTNEYLAASGSFNWHTRIGAFRFPSCGNQAPTIAITSPTAGSTVSGTITVSATAADPDGTVASVTFDLPDGTSVTDTTAPFSATFDTTNVADGGYVIRATATDNLGATAATTVTFTVVNGIGNCINSTLNSTEVPQAIPDNNATGITSNLSVVGNGNVATLSLSLNITHTFIGDLVVTLISPGGTQFVVWNRQGGSTHNLVITNQAITALNGQPAAGTWKLKVQDLAAVDVGTLNSWSLKIVGNCFWSGSAAPNLPTIDNGTACTSLTVTTTGGDSSLARLNISGRHDFCSILRGTLAHNGATVEAFPTSTFPAGACNFSFTNRAVPGLSGDAGGTWTICIVDTDGFGDTGVLNTWSVHD